MAESVFEREDRIRAASLTMAQTFYLCTLNRFMGKNDSAWPSHPTIADSMNTTIRSVIRYQNELQELGVLEVVIRKGCKTSNEYRILFDKLPLNSDRLSPLKQSRIVTDCHPIGDRLSCQIVTDCHTELLNRKNNEQDTGNLPVSGESLPPKISKSETALKTFAQTWNQWHSEGIVRSRIANPEAIGKELRKSWNRGWKDLEQRERLQNLQAIRDAIVRSQRFLKDANWFDAANLVGGKNKNCVWYAKQLLVGVYERKPETRQGPTGWNGTPDLPVGCPAWSDVLRAIRDIDVTEQGYPEKLKARLGEQPAKEVIRIGVKRIQDANDFQRRDMAAIYAKEMAGCQ